MPIFGWCLVRVNGHSMMPALAHGDFVVGRRYADYNLGNIVLVDHSYYGRVVKCIHQFTDDGRVMLKGKSSMSTSTEDLGLIDRSQIVARVVWRVSPSGMMRMPD